MYSNLLYQMEEAFPTPYNILDIACEMKWALPFHPHNVTMSVLVRSSTITSTSDIRSHFSRKDDQNEKLIYSGRNFRI